MKRAARSAESTAGRELNLVAPTQRTHNPDIVTAATALPAAERGGSRNLAPEGGGVGGQASTLQRQPVGLPLDARAGADLVGALRLADEFGGARLLLSDMRTAFLLVNHARHRTIARLFGVSSDQANLLTLVAALTLAEAVHEKVERLLSAPSVPSLGDGLLASASLRELLAGVAGPPAHETPLSSTLLMIAVVGGTAGPAGLKSLRAIKASSHRMAVGFHHRYGYIVDPGHWRQRRAQRPSGAPRPTVSHDRNP
jgi:hypothetical protein